MNKHLEMIELCGGIDSCIKKIECRDKLKHKATYFSIHPEKPHLIQMYTRNECKLVPNYRFDLLEKAIQYYNDEDFVAEVLDDV